MMPSDAKRTIRIPRPVHVVLVVLLGLALACGKNDEPNPEAKANGAAETPNSTAEASGDVTLSDDAVQRYGIETQSVSQRVLIPTITAPARIAFDSETIAHVGSPLNGRVTELRARVGDSVELGAVLLVIESPELGEAQSDFLSKRAAAAAAIPAIELAKSSFERAKALYDKSQGITLTEVQKREGDYRTAEAARLSAQVAVTGAENRLHLLGMSQAAIESLAKSGELDAHYAIKAPLAGEIIERNVFLGELVRPETDAILVIADTSSLWVLANVPESRLQDVVLSSPARITMGTKTSAESAGTVAFVSAAVDPSSRSAQVRIETKNAQHAMRPGMFAQVEIEVSTSASTPRSVLAVPDEAIQTIDGEPCVFVPRKTAKNTFSKRAVTIGAVVGGWVPVLSGVEEGETVVSAGSFLLKAELGKGTAGED